MRIYPNNLKNQNLDCTKAPRLTDKRLHVSNIVSLTIGQSRELSRQPKFDSSGCLGIILLFLLFAPALVFGEIQWSSPQKFPYSKKAASSPATAMNQHGDGIIIWYNHTSETLQSSLYHAKSDIFTSPIDIPCDKNFQNPKVILDEKKNAILLWIDEKNVSLHAIYYDAFLNQWMKPITLSVSQQSITSPELVGDMQGSVFAIWRIHNEINEVIQTARYHQGTWSSVVNISLVGFDCDDPHICIDQKGNAMAVWSTSNPVDQQMVVQASRFDLSSKKWSPPFTLSGKWSDCHYLHPRVISDSSDNFHAIWTQQGEHQSNIQTANFNSKLRKWSLPSHLSSERDSHHPFLVGCGEGLFAIWQTKENGDSYLSYSTYRNAYQWSQVTNLYKFENDIQTIQFASDTHGKANMIWSYANKIYAAQYEVPAWNQAAIIADQNNIRDLQLVGDKMGNSFAVWEKDHQIYYAVGDYLLPPKTILGIRRQKRFPAKTVHYIDLRWTPSCSPNLKGHRIYRDGICIGFVHPEQGHFLDYKCPSHTISYTITSVNHGHLESYPIEITIP